MASSYTGLGTELMTTGENAGTWGTTTNTNLQIIEQISGGFTEQAVTTTTTLSVSDGSAGAELAHRVIEFTGTMSANSTVTVPLDVQQMYILKNSTASSGHTLTFKYVSGSGSTVAFAATDKGTKIVYATANHATNPDMVDTGISTNTLTGVTGDITVDSPADIILDADGADVILKDGGTQYGTLTNSSSNLLIKSGSTTAATFSGANVTFAGTIGSGAVTSTGIVTGTGFTAGSAVLAEAELELLDGLTAGTAIASKVVTTDSSIDTTGQRNLTISGELDAATLDISGNADIDGTTNLDAVDIDGAVQLDATLTIGADDQGYDVIFYGDAASANMTWDTSVDDLILNGAARIVIPDGQLVLGSTAVTSTAAEVNLIDGGTSRGTTAVASGDGLLVNDGGTMRMTNVDTVSTYFASHSVGGGNIVTTGALDSGSITSGFGAIDNGTSGIRTNTFTAETSILPDASGGADIGSTSAEWGDIFIADDKAIKFGSGQDVSVEYDEDGTDSLLISGGDVTIVDDKKLYFGTGQDVYLEYDEDGTDKLIIKGNTTFLDGSYDFDIASHDTSNGLKLGGTLVSATAAELNYSDLATLGTSAASKVLSADSNNLTKITGGVYLEEDTLSFDATQDWDVRASPVAQVTLTANVTFDLPSNPTTGQYISILCIQDGTGSRTIAWNAAFEFTGGTAPTATTTAGKGDLFTFRYHNSHWIEVGRNLNLTRA